MNKGDCIRLTHFQNRGPRITTHWKAPKGQVFVAVILGTESKEGSDQLDLFDAMKEMGWMPIVEMEKRTR